VPDRLSSKKINGFIGADAFIDFNQNDPGCDDVNHLSTLVRDEFGHGNARTRVHVTFAPVQKTSRVTSDRLFNSRYGNVTCSPAF
jgi:hypothetical protein